LAQEAGVAELLNHCRTNIALRLFYYLLQLAHEGRRAKAKRSLGRSSEDGGQVGVVVEVACEIFEDVGGQVAVLFLFFSFEVILSLLS
jgi:hypothetical protein